MQYIQVVATDGKEALELVNSLHGWVYFGLWDTRVLASALQVFYLGRAAYMLLNPGTREFVGLSSTEFIRSGRECTTYPARDFMDTYLVSYNDN